MTLTVQQSLLEVGGGTPMVESALWIEGAMLGEIALGVCGLAVAFIGALMLTGRLPLREGARIVVGCFVLLCAPTIALGFVDGAGQTTNSKSMSRPVFPTSEKPQVNLAPVTIDPYAGV